MWEFTSKKVFKKKKKQLSKANHKQTVTEYLYELHEFITKKQNSQDNSLTGDCRAHGNSQVLSP